MKLTTTQDAVLKQVAIDLGANWKWIYWLIYYESKWNPKAINKRSGNAGLLQFSKVSAKAMGYNSPKDIISQYPTIEEQLQGPVLEYLKQYAPFKSMMDLASIIFVPKYRGEWNKKLPAKIAAANNVTTVGEYVQKVVQAMQANSEV